MKPAKPITHLKNARPAIIFIVLNILLIALGMGVPIFAILFGFGVGWFIPRYVKTPANELQGLLKGILRYSASTAAFTFLLMGVIWGGTLQMLSNPNFDYANFGIPMILYDPKTSFYAWLVLMVVISPFLQFLTTLFGAILSLVKNPPVFTVEKKN